MYHELGETRAAPPLCADRNRLELFKSGQTLERQYKYWIYTVQNLHDCREAIGLMTIGIHRSKMAHHIPT